MIESIQQCIESFEEKILEMERSPDQGNVRGVLDLLGVSNIRLPSTQLIALLDMLSDGITPVNSEIVTGLLTMAEAQKKFLYSLAGLLENGLPTANSEPDQTQTTELAEDSVLPKSIPEPEAATTEDAPEASIPVAKASTGNKAKTQAISSIRVETDRLDSLITLVGKLTVTFAVISQSGNNNIAKTTSSLRELNSTISTLQAEIDAIRMVPLKQIFMPMHRLVNSLAQKIGKKIKLEVVGEDLALDKSIVEYLNEPLIHLLRNAVDHGLETVEQRKDAGKNPVGSILLTAWRKGEMAYVQVADDGRGLDVDRIREKALAKGMMTLDQDLDDDEISQFILKSGFSTAKEVTDVSGRGVGMDAVVNVIRTTLDGDMEIQNTPGRGAAFTLSVPLSHSATEGIVEALVCRLGQDTFIIPSQDVVEIYVPRHQDVVDLPDGRQTVDVRGEVHSMLHLSRQLDIPSAVDDLSQAQAVVVRSGDIRAAILVDEVIRQQQVVITKFTMPVEEFFQVPILGFGMMGESDALVVDVEALLQNVEFESST